ncbi:MAG: S1C family serine protease [Bdellovibrionota bacterium]|jgi:S1-C subfamily serine protease
MRVLSFFVGIVLAILIGALLGEYVSPDADSQVARRSVEEQLTIDIYKSTNEAVVFISTVTLTVDPFDWFSEIRPNQGAGTGTIVDAKKGIVVTNLHVIQNAHAIEILLGDGQAYKAKLLGYDRQYDIAVLQIKNPPKHLKSIPFGDSTKLQIGQRVLAIGNPFGLNRTLTTGIVSSLDRTVKTPAGALMKGLIQTDAAINPGNSGGPLIDMDGNLVGVNSAILSQSGDSAGIGFAVPMHQIRRILPELIATGKVLRPDLGWVLVDTNQGPMVRRVVEGGSAALAGVMPLERPVSNAFVKGYLRDFEKADLIYKVNGVRVYSRNDVEEIISQTEAGSEITFTLRRGSVRGFERELKIKPNLS